MGKMGRMGKPQKTRKHKKIKEQDPEKRPFSDRKAELANQAPTRKTINDDIPGSIDEVVMAEHSNAARRKRKKHNKFQQQPPIKGDPSYQLGMTRPLRPVPVFKQRKGESDKLFAYRMDRETQEVLNKAAFEDKYDVEVNVTKSGQYKFEKRPKPEEDGATGAESKRKKRNQKKAEKRKQSKQHKLMDKVHNFEEFQDEVKFGEVAMAPPSLTAKPRNIQDKTNRPGTKSLLLANLVKSKGDQPRKSAPKASAPRAVGQSVKRKHMSVAQQRISDKERDRAIDMYRQIKKQKLERKQPT